MRTTYCTPILCFALLLTAAIPSSAKDPGELGGTYTGEVVVRSLSSTRVVVALDEHGLGRADRLFFVDSAQPVGPFSSRSAVSKVEYSTGELVVVVPREQRAFFFAVPSGRQGAGIQRLEAGQEIAEGSIRAELDEGFLQTLGFEAVRISGVLQLAAYSGMRENLSLDDVERGNLSGAGLRSIASKQAPQPQPSTPVPLPTDPDRGSGCATSCSVSCGGGSSCSSSCTNGHCASCSCVEGHGASCGCN